MEPLDHLIEQLWAPALAHGGLRIRLNPEADPAWQEVESYWVLPGARMARLLVPKGPARMTARSLTNYRGLRLWWKNVARATAGQLARTGFPMAADVLSVQVSRAQPDRAACLPIRRVSEATGVWPLFAIIGVRTGDNRKASLSLLDLQGSPVAHAKVGWNQVSDHAVANEADVLRLIGGRQDAMRAPRLLHRLDYFGHPLVVTEALPLDVRGSYGRMAAITSTELYALTPVVRRATVRDTRHFSRLAARLNDEAKDPVCAEIAAAALPLVRRLRAAEVLVPVCARWHGDLTPWNRARGSGGQLWVWDWEDSEEDTAAGLDAVHWTFSLQRSPSSRLRRLDLSACLQEAGSHLTAAGVPRGSWPLVAGVYALVVVERACALAVQHHGWEDSWISRADLRTLLGQAEELLRDESVSAAAGAA